MKKILLVIISLTMIFGLFGCKKSNKASLTNENKEKEITILIPQFEKEFIKDEIEKLLQENIRKFSQETGTKVSLETVNVKGNDDYIKKRNLKLLTDRGPTLILVTSWSDSAQSLIEQGVAFNIKGKIPNQQNIIKGLKDEYLIPFALCDYDVRILKREILKEIGVQEPDYDWSIDDYIKIKNEWLNKNPEYVDFLELSLDFLYKMNTYKEVDLEQKKIKYNIEALREFLKDSRQKIFSSKYVQDKNYSYDDWYSLFFNENSPERSKIIELNRKKEKVYFEYMFHDFQTYLNPLSIKPFLHKENIEANDILINPYPDIASVYYTGFLVNRKGKNIEEGVKFINYLISDDAQRDFTIRENRRTYLKYPHMAPVVTTINDDLLKFAQENNEEDEFQKGMEYRNFIIDKINDGDIRLKHRNEFEVYCSQRFLKILVEIVFADEDFSDQEIDNKLKKLKNELNLYLNE